MRFVNSREHTYYVNKVQHQKSSNPKTGADLGFFVPQSKFFGGRGVIGAGRGRLQAGGRGGVGAK